MPSHEQWMAWCEHGARIFGTCSRRVYMAIVLSESGRVLGTGYNGAPSGYVHCVDGGCPRASSEASHGSSYGNCVAVHAEANALLHSDRSAREGGTLYVNGPPCWECSKLIAGSGITTVVHTSDLAYKDWPKCQALLESVGILVVSLISSSNKPGNDCSSMGVRTECPVDLASRVDDRTPLVDSDCTIPPLGLDALIPCNDGTYDVQSNP